MEPDFLLMLKLPPTHQVTSINSVNYRHYKSTAGPNILEKKNHYFMLKLQFIQKHTAPVFSRPYGTPSINGLF